MNPSNNSVFIYWEKQGSDKLCGVHALNSILQGPFYTEFQLAEIARELDQQEAQLLGKGSVGFDKHGQTTNVAGDGNFSIQVLSEALKRTSGLACVSIDSESINKEDLGEEQGFICNSSEHWLSIRKINGKWYNLNSTNKEGPEIISDFYLSAFILSVKENGYVIFVVQGDFPQYDKSFFGDIAPHQRFFSEKQCEEIHQRNLKKKNYKLNIGGTDERDLEEALQRSLQEYGGGAGENEEDQLKKAMEASMKDNYKEDTSEFASKFGKQKEEPEKKFDAFKGQGVSLTSSSLSNDLESYFSNLTGGFDPNQDPEMALAVRLSLGVYNENLHYFKEDFSMKPKSDDDNFSLNFRLPDGKVQNWVFNKNSDIHKIYNYIAATCLDLNKFKISFGFPRKALSNLNVKIAEAGIENEDTLLVEKL